MVRLPPFSVPRVLFYFAVCSLGGAFEDWRHVGWSFNIFSAAAAFVLAFVIERQASR